MHACQIYPTAMVQVESYIALAKQAIQDAEEAWGTDKRERMNTRLMAAEYWIAEAELTLDSIIKGGK